MFGQRSLSAPAAGFCLLSFVKNFPYEWAQTQTVELSQQMIDVHHHLFLPICHERNDTS